MVGIVMIVYSHTIKLPPRQVIRQGMPYNLAQVFGIQDTMITAGEWELTISKKGDMGSIENLP